MASVSVELWYQALATPLGVIVRVSDPERAKMRLYALRKEANDPDLDSLSIVQSPTNPGEELWIVRRKKDAAP